MHPTLFKERVACASQNNSKCAPRACGGAIYRHVWTDMCLRVCAHAPRRTVVQTRRAGGVRQAVQGRESVWQRGCEAERTVGDRLQLTTDEGPS